MFSSQGFPVFSENTRHGLHTAVSGPLGSVKGVFSLRVHPFSAMPWPSTLFLSVVITFAFDLLFASNEKKKEVHAIRTLTSSESGNISVK